MKGIRKLIQGHELTLTEAKDIGDITKIKKNIPIKYIITGYNYLGEPCDSKQKKLHH